MMGGYVVCGTQTICAAVFGFSQDAAATSGNPQRYNLRLPTGATTKVRDLEDKNHSELGHGNLPGEGEITCFGCVHVRA